MVVFFFFLFFFWYRSQDFLGRKTKKYNKKKKEKKNPTTLRTGEGETGGETNPQNLKEINKPKEKASERLRQHEPQGPTGKPRRWFAKDRGGARARPGRGAGQGDAPPARAGSGERVVLGRSGKVAFPPEWHCCCFRHPGNGFA